MRICYFCTEAALRVDVLLSQSFCNFEESGASIILAAISTKPRAVTLRKWITMVKNVAILADGAECWVSSVSG